MTRPKDRDLFSQVSALSAELELATFLNKGVLLSNSEYKVRIVELERENAVLRVAESRLARTEDRLAVAEKQLRERAESEELEWNRMVLGTEVLRESLERANRRLEGIAGMAVVEHVSVSRDAESFVTVSFIFDVTELRFVVKRPSTSIRRKERDPSPSSQLHPSLPTLRKKQRVMESSPPVIGKTGVSP